MTIIMVSMHIEANSPPAGLSGRIRLLLLLLGLKLALGLALRVGLYLGFHDGPRHPGPLLLLPVAGLLTDLPVAFLGLFPLGLLLLLPAGIWNRGWVRVAAGAAVFAPLLFYSATEWFFFEEFSARFNHIALDYVTAPREVAGNIWQSYNVPAIVAATLAGGLLFGWLFNRMARRITLAPLGRGGAMFAFGTLLTVSAFALALAAAVPARLSGDRVISEIAHNGFSQLVRAYRTADLEYDLYYPTLPTAVEHAHAALALGIPPPAPGTPAGGFVPLREFGGAASGDPYDVVVILEESFGSEFIGELGHPERLTSPGFDRWSKRGLLATHMIPVGNRTVRGIEGVLSSFPPLPGDSTVKRDRSENMAGLGRAFRGAGYDTAFYYGGWGVFDNMKPYALANGFTRFVERDAYPKDALATIWGVADEYVFNKLLEDQLAAKAGGTRFFATLLSTSNHKPYRVPDRPTRIPAARHDRDAAVAYADWALANYLDRAQAAGLLGHTVVLVVGDHGARVYGAQELPTASYKVPALFLAPGLAGARYERLCSQVDIAPTLLSLAGVHAHAPFFGGDLTAAVPPPERAFLIHNRDIGYLTPDKLVILGLNKSVEQLRRAGVDSDEFTPIPESEVTAADRERAQDAIALFQLADDLYRRRKYRLPDLRPEVASARQH